MHPSRSVHVPTMSDSRPKNELFFNFSFLGPNEPFRLCSHNILCPTGPIKEENCDTLPLRILGFYVSGFVMIVISVDRLSAIIYPLAHRANTRRTRWHTYSFVSKIFQGKFFQLSFIHSFVAIFQTKVYLSFCPAESAESAESAAGKLPIWQNAFGCVL